MSIPPSLEMKQGSIKLTKSFSVEEVAQSPRPHTFMAQSSEGVRKYYFASEVRTALLASGTIVCRSRTCFVCASQESQGMQAWIESIRACVAELPEEDAKTNATGKRLLMLPLHHGLSDAHSCRTWPRCVQDGRLHVQDRRRRAHKRLQQTVRTYLQLIQPART